MFAPASAAEAASQVAIDTVTRQGVPATNQGCQALKFIAAKLTTLCGSICQC